MYFPNMCVRQILIALFVLFIITAPVHSSDILPGAIGDSWNVDLVGRWANGPCNAVFVEGTTAYFGNGAYLEIVDFSDPANPYELGKPLVPGTITDIVVSGSFAYVADGYAGLRIIDVSIPESPAEVGYFDTGGYAVSVALSGSYAYIADRFGGLRIIDVSIPGSPTEIGYYITEYAEDVAVNGSYAYVADGSDGLYILSFSTATGDDSPTVPAGIALRQNIPNPFNPSTTIRFDIPERMMVDLSVYDVTGKLVCVLLDEIG